MDMEEKIMRALLNASVDDKDIAVLTGVHEILPGEVGMDKKEVQERIKVLREKGYKL